MVGNRRDGAHARTRRLTHVPAVLLALCAASAVTTSAFAANTNACPPGAPVNAAPPTSIPFGTGVTVFDPSMSVTAINAALNAAAGNTPPNNGRRHFYFMPGTYGNPNAAPPQIDGVPVGTSPSAAAMMAAANAAGIISAPMNAHTIVAGLGKSPCDVVINGALFIQNGGLSVTQRRLENLTLNPIEANTPVNQMHWASSQTAVWRRVNFLGDVQISNQQTGSQNFGAMFMNSNIVGKLINGNQKMITATPLQPDGYGNAGNGMYYIQGSTIGGLTGYGALTQFIGTVGGPDQNFGPGPVGQPGGDIGNLALLPIVRESPFIQYNTVTNQFEVVVPKVMLNRRGHYFGAAGPVLPFSSFYVANPSDTATTLNAQLAAGKNLILNPGNYSLSEPLTITRANTVVFGLGNASVAGVAGVGSVKIADSAIGVVLAGFAVGGTAPGSGPTPDYQVQIGVNGGTGSLLNPTTLTDINVGSQATTAVVINQNYVIQNQGEVNTGTSNASAASWAIPQGSYGIVVNGHHVTLQGLYIEHFKKIHLTWNGEDGQVHYLVNEPPYTPYYPTPNVTPTTWQMSDTFVGYPTIFVNKDVERFSVEGFMTAYRFNSGCRCEIEASIVTPVKPGISFRNVIGVGITFPAAAGSTLVAYDPTQLNGELGQVPRQFQSAPGLTVNNQQFSTTGTYAVGGIRHLFAIHGSDGSVTPVGPGALTLDVAPGPGAYGPGGTMRQPFSDVWGFGITTRIAQFP